MGPLCCSRRTPRPTSIKSRITSQSSTAAASRSTGPSTMSVRVSASVEPVFEGPAPDAAFESRGVVGARRGKAASLCVLSNAGEEGVVAEARALSPRSIDVHPITAQRNFSRNRAHGELRCSGKKQWLDTRSHLLLGLVGVARCWPAEPSSPSRTVQELAATLARGRRLRVRYPRRKGVTRGRANEPRLCVVAWGSRGIS